MTNPIPVTYHCEPDGWWAESDDVPGFSATASNLTDLRQLTHDGIALALGRATVPLAEKIVPSSSVNPEWRTWARNSLTPSPYAEPTTVTSHQAIIVARLRPGTVSND